MYTSCNKDVSSSSSEFSKCFTESDESVYSETSETVILIIHMNIMKMTFLKIYQLQWTLRIKIMMINGFK